MSSNHLVLKYLSKTLDYAIATVVGSSLAGFCCVMMAVQCGFDAKAGLPISILLASLNMQMIYRACDDDRFNENISLAWRIVGMVMRLLIPMFFWALGVYSAFVIVG